MTTPNDQDFYSCADAFIHVANSQAEGIARSRVSAALMFASARYSAFNAKAAGETNVEEVIEYLVEEYRAMLKHNMTDATIVRGERDGV